MDQNNEIYEIYKYVLGCYEDGTDWRTACAGVVKNRVNCKLIGSADEAGFSINANAGMIFIGLLYGKNDFEKSVKITSLCGLDGDCTAATVGGLLGLIVGFDALPQKYKDFLNGNSVYYNYTGKNSDETGVYWGAIRLLRRKLPHFPDLRSNHRSHAEKSRGAGYGQGRRNRRGDLSHCVSAVRGDSSAFSDQ